METGLKGWFQPFSTHWLKFSFFLLMKTEENVTLFSHMLSEVRVSKAAIFSTNSEPLILLVYLCLLKPSGQLLSTPAIGWASVCSTFKLVSTVGELDPNADGEKGVSLNSNTDTRGAGKHSTGNSKAMGMAWKTMEESDEEVISTWVKKQDTNKLNQNTFTNIRI